VVIGSYADYRNYEGLNNTIIGYEAGYSNSFHEKSGNVFIGNRAGYDENGNNKLYINNSSGGASNSLIYGEFDNDILTFNASVGIGTINPGKQFELSNSEDAWLRIAADSDNSGGDDGTQNAYLQFTTDNNAEDYDGLIWLENLSGDTKLHFDVENYEVMVLSNGRLGIGTDSPLASVSNSPVMVTDGTKTTAPTGINWQINDYGGYALGVENVATGGSGLLVDAGNNSGTGATVANFVSSNNSLMYIGENGNIGINNTAPARKLHINDVMRLEPRASAPASPSEGDLYVNSTDHHIYCYLNGTWKQLD
jgi:hypothetical protein